MKKSFLKFWRNPCQLIYMVMALLLLIGGTNVFSASFVTARDMTGSGIYFFIRYFIFALIGLGLMHAVRKLGYKWFLRKNIINMGCVIVLGLLVIVTVFGVANKGAARWIYLGPISLQPSEFAKLAVILLSARYLGDLMRRGESISAFATSESCTVLACTALYAGLIYKQPDLGTTAIVVALVFGVYVIAGLSKKEITLVFCVLLVAAVVTTLISPYRMDRVKVWFDPWLDPREKGYQMVQSLLAIGSGGLFGEHWGSGAGKFFYLPEAHTDFAFAIFCQENGFIGAVLLLVLFALLGFALCTITATARDRQGFLLAGGVTFLIIGQAIANMAMVCGVLPVIGVPLVFISYGGSSMVLSMVAIGLLLSVYDEERRVAAHEALPPEERRDGLRMVRNEGWRR
jgi:cell division protein FtsW